MGNENEEAAVNALHAQHVYGDEDLKRDVENLIVNAVVKALHSRQSPIVWALADSIAPLVLENTTTHRKVEKIVARYLMSKLQSEQY